MEGIPITRIPVQKRWSLKKVEEQQVIHLQQALKIHPAICRILVARGITTFEEAKNFFRPSLSMLHDPFLMKDMEKAVSRIIDALEWNEKILVYGDYDVDGTTAVSVVYSFLRDLYKGQLSYYIPHRYKEGYGLSKQGVDFAIQNRYSLLIMLDCGIRSAELVAYAKANEIDTIICDHHLPDENNLPQALAILNPKQEQCSYPFKELSGCGIGFKLIQGIAQRLNIPDEATHRYLDLVATSIAADIVSMEDENRVLSYYGIQKANEEPMPSIAQLKKIAGIDRKMHVSDLVFVIGPRVNAAGRIDDATKAVDLFVEKDEDKIVALAEQLQQDNVERKEYDKTTTQEALALLYNKEENRNFKSTVLFQEHWHKGVVGIVASRLIDHFHRPTIVLTQSQAGKISGSARSVEGYNIYEAIHECRDLLDNYGGHNFAAGLTLPATNLDAFKERFEQVVAQTISPEMLIPEIKIDAEINLIDVQENFYKIINQFEPFGPNNLRPVFLTRKVHDFKGLSRLIKDTHIKFTVHQNSGFIINGIGFGMYNKWDIVKGGIFDMVYTIEENEFQGHHSLQLRVLDVKPS